MLTCRKIMLFAVFLLIVSGMPAGCGKDERLKEHSGTYILERGQGEFREIRTLELKDDGRYSYEKVSGSSGEMLESKSGEWIIVMDRMRPGGRAIILEPLPTNITRFEVKDDGILLETVSDAAYERK